MLASLSDKRQVRNVLPNFHKCVAQILLPKFCCPNCVAQIVLPKLLPKLLPKRCCPNRKLVFRLRKTSVWAPITRTSSTLFFGLAQTIWAALFKAKGQCSSPKYVQLPSMPSTVKGQSMCASLDHLPRPFAQDPTICSSSDRPFCPDLLKSRICPPKLRDRVRPRPQKPNEKTTNHAVAKNDRSLKRRQADELRCPNCLFPILPCVNLSRGSNFLCSANMLRSNQLRNVEGNLINFQVSSCVKLRVPTLHM